MRHALLDEFSMLSMHRGVENEFFFFLNTMIQDTRNAAQFSVWMQRLKSNALATTSPTRKKEKNNTMGVLREDRVDPPIHAVYFHSGEATTMNFIVNGTNAVNSFIMRSTIPWKRCVPRDNTTLAYNLADVNGTLHDVVDRSVVESAGFFTRGTWLDKHFHATETFGAIDDDVSVW